MRNIGTNLGTNLGTDLGTDLGNDMEHVNEVKLDNARECDSNKI